MACFFKILIVFSRQYLFIVHLNDGLGLLQLSFSGNRKIEKLLIIFGLETVFISLFFIFSSSDIIILLGQIMSHYQ